MKTYKITFSNGDSVTTNFNGDLKTAENYYLDDWFNFGDTDENIGDIMVYAVQVEVVK